MSSSLGSGQRTRTLARVMGPYLVIVTVTALVRAGDMERLVADFDASSAFTWVTGAVVLLVGLVVTALH